MDRRSMVGLIAVVAIVAVTMFAGCVEEPKYEGGCRKTHRIEEFGNPIIKGTTKNIGSSPLSYAEVRVKFYDREGTLAGYISGQYQ